MYPDSFQHKVQTSERISTLYCAYVLLFVFFVFLMSDSYINTTVLTSKEKMLF